MKEMKVFFCLFIVLGLLVSGCSKSSSKKEDPYTMTKAAKDGRVVVQAMTDHVTGGSFKTRNLKKLFLFTKGVKNGEKGKIKIPLFDKNGKLLGTSTLQYDGKILDFTDHFNGFPMPTGHYQCKSMAYISSRAQVGDCKNDQGKKFPVVVVLFAGSKRINQLVDQVLGGDVGVTLN